MNPTVIDTAQQRGLVRFLGRARLATYLEAAEGDVGRATDPLLWSTALSGALHAQLAHVEIAVRNAIDAQLAQWNADHGYAREWTRPGAAAPLLYEVLRRQLAEARARASKEAAERHPGHPRHRAGVTHDDVVAQLMFGAWVRLVRPISAGGPSDRQRRLWTEVVGRAFRGADPADAGREVVGNQLETLRRLRNRVAHHDNLLGVDVRHRLDGMLALLSTIDPGLPAFAARRSPLRRLVREDPRRSWPAAPPAMPSPAATADGG
jgi:hypothetical protein